MDDDFGFGDDIGGGDMGEEGEEDNLFGLNDDEIEDDDDEIDNLEEIDEDVDVVEEIDIVEESDNVEEIETEDARTKSFDIGRTKSGTIDRKKARILPIDQRKTIPKLTTFELVEVLTTRAKQISAGEPLLINYPAGKTPLDSWNIAQDEFKAGVLPMILRRILPNDEVEDWPLYDLMYFE